MEEDYGKALNTEYWNGFGFQWTDRGNGNGVLHLGKLFLAHASRQKYGYPCDAFEDEHEAPFLQEMHRRLPDLRGSITITEFLGRYFISLKHEHFSEIPLVLNTVLAIGDYGFVTQNKLQLPFRPGDTFSLIAMERKAIAVVKEVAQETRDFLPEKPEADLWRYVYRLLNLPVMTKHWNWSSPEGLEFCSWIREKLGKKPHSHFENRFTWPWYRTVCEKYGICYAGGWSKYDPLIIKAIR